MQWQDEGENKFVQNFHGKTPCKALKNEKLLEGLTFNLKKRPYTVILLCAVSWKVTEVSKEFIISIGRSQ
jgi:hypothetical protein